MCMCNGIAIDDLVMDSQRCKKNCYIMITRRLIITCLLEITFCFFENDVQLCAFGRNLMHPRTSWEFKNPSNFIFHGIVDCLTCKQAFEYHWSQKHSAAAPTSCRCIFSPVSTAERDAQGAPLSIRVCASLLSCRCLQGKSRVSRDFVCACLIE